MTGLQHSHTSHCMTRKVDTLHIKKTEQDKTMVHRKTHSRNRKHVMAQIDSLALRGLIYDHCPKQPVNLVQSISFFSDPDPCKAYSIPSVSPIVGGERRKTVQNLNGVKNHLFFPLTYLSSSAFLTVFLASSLCETSLNVSLVTTPLRPSSSRV